jgi:hypothetical protein
MKCRRPSTWEAANTRPNVFDVAFASRCGTIPDHLSGSIALRTMLGETVFGVESFRNNRQRLPPVWKTLTSAHKHLHPAPRNELLLCNSLGKQRLQRAFKAGDTAKNDVNRCSSHAPAEIDPQRNDDCRYSSNAPAEIGNEGSRSHLLISSFGHNPHAETMLLESPDRDRRTQQAALQ